MEQGGEKKRGFGEIRTGWQFSKKNKDRKQARKKNKRKIEKILHCKLVR